MQVIKIGGSDIDRPGFIEELAQIIKAMPNPPIVVHGGGKAISEMQRTFEIQPQYIDGLRVSDVQTLYLVRMVLCGMINPQIVELFQLAGIEAQGLSGIDRGLVRARKMQHPSGDLQRVGEVEAVRPEIIIDLLAGGITPVIAPICLGEDGIYNVNADHVAGAIGAAVKAERIVFLTVSGGVLQNDVLVEKLTPAEVETLIEADVIYGGMLPKVRTAVAMVEAGVKQVIITNLDGLKNNSGTTVQHESNHTN